MGFLWEYFCFDSLNPSLSGPSEQLFLYSFFGRGRERGSVGKSRKFVSQSSRRKKLSTFRSILREKKRREAGIIEEGGIQDAENYDLLVTILPLPPFQNRWRVYGKCFVHSKIFCFTRIVC